MSYPPLLVYSAVAVFGLIIGSFLNVVIHRLPRRIHAGWRNQCYEFLEMEKREGPVDSLVHPGSRCPHCHRAIKPWHNIPLVGYLMLRGRCADCGEAISPRYPLVEALSAVLFVLSVWRFGIGLAGLSAMILAAALIVLAFIDIDHQFLPDDIVLPVLWLGLLLNVAGIHADLSSAVLGAAAGYLALWTVYQLFRLLTGKEGMGYGDFKLLALLGAWLGWQHLPLVLLVSALAGSVLGIAQIALRRLQRDQPIPFGPYLAIAGWISLIWGDQIMTGYLQFTNLI